MKNYVKTNALALAITMSLGLGFTACTNDSNDNKTNNHPTSYVSIDVNPSLSLVLDEDKKVLSVLAENEDAQVLLYEEQLVGLSLEEAAQKIADLSVEMGYLHDNNYGVNVTVEGGENTISATVEAAFNKASEGENWELNFTTQGTFSDLRELKAINEEHGLNLTLGEYQMIVDAQSVDNTLTVKAAAQLPKEDLIALIQQKTEEVIPYATATYEHAKALALYTYQHAKASLIDKLWAVPYLNVFKYPTLTGLTYNLYSDAARTLAIALDGVEVILETKESTEISQEDLNKITATLQFSEEEAQAFIQAVTIDGKVTLASLENELNAYFKNMTAEEREATQAIFNEVLTSVQAIVTEIDASIDQQIKDSFGAITSDLNACIPEQMQMLATAYFNEYKKVVTEISKSVEGKEPVPAAYAALETLEENKARVYETMRTELSEGGDLETVEKSIENVNAQFTALEKQLNEAITQAETEAKNYFATLKAQRKA
jgi:hypothetical protein